MPQNKIHDRLRKVWEINRKDAEELVRTFEESGDAESLKRARADLRRWEDKLREAAQNGGIVQK